MTDFENLANLQEARDAKQARELLAQFEAASKADGIRPDGYLGRSHALLGLVLGRTLEMIVEDRADRLAFATELGERQLRHIEEARQMVEECRDTAKAELSKLDLMARKAEANNKRLELALEENATTLIKRLASDLTAAVKHGNVIRAKAYNRDRYLYAVSAGVVIVMLLLGIGYVTGRMTAPSPVADNQSQEESR